MADSSKPPAAAPAAAAAKGGKAGKAAAPKGGEETPSAKNTKDTKGAKGAKGAAATDATDAGAATTTTTAAAAGAAAAGAKKTIRLKTAYVNPTPKGEKKDTSGEMPKEYDPPMVEAAWYEWWEKKGFFTPDAAAAVAAKPATPGDDGSAEAPFVIVIPPPNVTGALHLGHALGFSIQDTLCRFHRMRGRRVMWLPGTDHAGIATQSVVEKKLARQQPPVSRHQLGRERFLEEVWKWKDEYGGRILTQLRTMGFGLDWTRLAFTMDEKLSRAVLECFVRFYDDGLIYRDTRLVNWCCALGTAIADIEVDKVELTGPTRIKVPGHARDVEFGVLTKFAYEVVHDTLAADGKTVVETRVVDELVVATTRPETMLADTGIAIHPADPRYLHLHGLAARHPFHPERRLPIVLDDKDVDMNFGTGAVKVTPAHDADDFRRGKRFGLAFISLFNDDGTVNAEGGARFAGMRRFEAREAVVEALKELGLFRGTEASPMSLPLCSRSKDVIEPMLKPQWWVDCQDMAAKAVAAVRDRQLDIQPANYRDTWFRWLENIQPWCISRQLWWGHRIPAYRVLLASDAADVNPASVERWVVGRSLDDARARAAAKYAGGDAAAVRQLVQDEDVLDTWFSSGLFPFSVFGWPDEDSVDLRAFYPNSLLETGYDILFFWVARMVMMGQRLTGRLPFRQVLLHPLVRDAHGKKMSKSDGNAVDPIDVIEGITLADLHRKLELGNMEPARLARAKEAQQKDFPAGISECGTDALRFGLMASTSSVQGPARDINLDINVVVTYREFCNKIWNACKFGLYHFAADPAFRPLLIADVSAAAAAAATVSERWILSRLSVAVAGVTAGLLGFEFSQATSAAHSFWLLELCDVFIELAKPLLAARDSPQAASARQTLYTCLCIGLQLLHPMMPFVTEELWQRLPRPAALPAAVESISQLAMPRPDDAAIARLRDVALEADMALARDIIHAFRSLRAPYANSKSRDGKPLGRLPMQLRVADAAVRDRLAPFLTDIAELSKGASLVFTAAAAAGDDDNDVSAVSVVAAGIEALLPLADFIDPATEIKKLTASKQKAQQQLDALRRTIALPQYTTKVPKDVQASNAVRVGELEQEIAATDKAIAKFSKL